MTTLFTVGHGTLPADELAALLQGAGVVVVVDIRAFPGSRAHPQFSRQAMESWLPAAGFEYRWDGDLGGRRRGRPDSRHVALRHASFRAYADHMETAEFKGGLERALGLAAARPTAVMCSESVWWRCHRRLVADAAVLVHDAEVLHLFHDGRLQAHPVMTEARREDGDVVYDRGQPPLL